MGNRLAIIISFFAGLALSLWLVPSAYEHYVWKALAFWFLWSWFYAPGK